MLTSSFAQLFCAGPSTSDTLALPLCYRTGTVYAIISHYRPSPELWTLVRFSAKAFRKAGRRSLRSKPRPKIAKSTDCEKLCGTPIIIKAGRSVSWLLSPLELKVKLSASSKTYLADGLEAKPVAPQTRWPRCARYGSKGTTRSTSVSALMPNTKRSRQFTKA